MRLLSLLALALVGCYGSELRLGTAHTLNDFSGSFGSSGTTTLEDGYDTATGSNSAFGDLDQDDSTTFFVELAFQLSPQAVTLTNPTYPIDWIPEIPTRGLDSSPQRHSGPGTRGPDAAPHTPDLSQLHETREDVARLRRELDRLVTEMAKIAAIHIPEHPTRTPEQPPTGPETADSLTRWLVGGTGGVSLPVLGWLLWRRYGRRRDGEAAE